MHMCIVCNGRYTCELFYMYWLAWFQTLANKMKSFSSLLLAGVTFSIGKNIVNHFIFNLCIFLKKRSWNSDSLVILKILNVTYVQEIKILSYVCGAVEYFDENSELWHSDFDNWGETCSVLNKNNSEVDVEVDVLETSIVQMFIPWRSQAKNEKKIIIFQYSTKLKRSVVVYLINSFQGIGLFCEGEKKWHVTVNSFWYSMW